MGPYYEAGAAQTTVLAGPGEPGERLQITGRLFAGGCETALAGATIEIWHADAGGNYRDGAHKTPLRAVMTSDCDGRFAFSTILPGTYLDTGGYRPRPVHFMVTTPAAKLVTQLYFEGDPYLSPNDSCTACGSDDKTHIVALKTSAAAGNKHHVGHFDIVA